MIPHYDYTPTDTFKRMNKTEKEHRYASDLTPEEIDRFRILNRFLRSYEEKILLEIKSLSDYGRQKVASMNEWVDCRDSIEISVSFFLDENDEAWDEDDDNIIVIMLEHVYDPLRTFLGDGEDWGLVGIAPDIGETHCSMFHSLYDHTDLSWDDMLRIRGVDVDFNLNVGHEEEKI